jgi:cupin 2 domain-containing protein
MKANLFENIPNELQEELFMVLAESEHMKVERIVSDGHASPEGFWYDQQQNEWVLLVSGSAVLSIEKDTGVEQVELTPGDHLLIPPHQRHRVEATSQTEKTIWVAVFYSP